MGEKIDGTHESDSSPSRHRIDDRSDGVIAPQNDAKLPPWQRLQQRQGNHAVQQLLRAGVVQTKLRISEPGDAAEQEAERAAGAVTGVTEAAREPLPIRTPADPLNQPTPERAVQSGGQPLPEAERAFFEDRFGRELGAVRIHHDSAANEAARTLSARAFTVGTDIVFGQGEFQPGSDQGRHLLAHELAHTIQQSESPFSIQREVSFELQDAQLPKGGKPADLAEDEARVQEWLREHAPLITAAEAKFRVDRRAIAGAIAWEALRNVRSWSLRAVGPGKVHYDELIKKSAAQEVEEAGYLPNRQPNRRAEVLATPAGAVVYIGAIMAAFADEAEKPHSGGWQGEDIRLRPEILTNAYQAETPSSWREHLEQKKPGQALQPGNEMALWVTAHLKFLEGAVGKPCVPQSRSIPGAPHLIKTAQPPPEARGLPNLSKLRFAELQAELQRLELRLELFSGDMDPHQRKRTEYEIDLVKGALAPMEETRKQADQKPADNRGLADWIIRAQQNGFVLFNPKFRPERDLQAIVKGDKIGTIDPGQSEPLPALVLFQDQVKVEMKRWIAAGCFGAKQPLWLNSLITAGDGSQRVGLHGAGRAVDFYYQSPTPARVIESLEALAQGSYELGLPFASGFFPGKSLPEREAAAQSEYQTALVVAAAAQQTATAQDKAKAHPEAPALPILKDGLLLSRTEVFTSQATVTGSEASAAAKEPGQGAGGAEKLPIKLTWSRVSAGADKRAYEYLEDAALKDKIANLRGKGYTLAVFPDNPGHVHLGQSK